MKFAGPELVWLLSFALATLLVRRNRPPTEAGSDRLQKIGSWLTTLTALLSFVPGFWAPRWLILRALLAGAVGVPLVSFRILSGINYRDSRNSGLLGTLFYFLLFGCLALGAGLIAALVTFGASSLL
ncbi:MAG TPA: hypothetical protein VF950_30250 [Planctomycetota bacterium]